MSNTTENVTPIRPELTVKDRVEIAGLYARIAAIKTKECASSVANNKTVREAAHGMTIGAAVGGGAYAGLIIVDRAARWILGID